MNYNLFVSVVFFISGALLTLTGTGSLGVVFIALGATFLGINQMNGNDKPQ